MNKTNPIVLILAILLLASSVNAIPKPTASWTMDNNATNDQFGRYNTTAEPNAGALQTIPGIYGNATWQFAMSRLVLQDTLLKEVTSFSVCAWVNSTSGSVIAIGNAEGANNHTFKIRRNAGATSTWVFHVWDGTDTERTATTTSLSGLNKWVYLCGVCNGTDAIIYVNGTQEASATLTGGISQQPGRVSLFAAALGGDQMSGYLDEVVIFDDYALTDPEVLDLYNNGNGLQYPYYALTNCTNNETPITLDLSMRNELSPEDTLRGNISVYITYPDNDLNDSFIRQNITSIQLCSPTNTSVLDANIYAQYSTDNGFTHKFYVINTTLSNSTKNYTMYNTNTTNGFSDLVGTVRKESDYTHYPGVFVQLQRFYVGEGTWRTVQMDKSAEYGAIFFDIQEHTVDYRLRFYDQESRLLETTQSLTLSCDEYGICDLTFLIPETIAGVGGANIQVTWSFDNITKNLSVNWQDSSDQTSDVTLFVTKQTSLNSSVICREDATGSAGTLNCNLTGYHGTFAVQLYSSASPNSSKFFVWLDIAPDRLWNLISRAESSFWTVGFVVTAFIAGIANPVYGIVMIVFSFFGLSFLGIASTVNITIIIIIAALGILIGLGIKRQ